MAYDLLSRTKRVPGTRPDGSLDPSALRRWITAVRNLAVARQSTESADRQIGVLLAADVRDPDGV
jgi:hypothetical protein